MRNRSGYYRQRKQTRLILWVCVCVRKRRTLAVLSAEVVAKRQPSGETWQERMAPWWASTSWSFSPLSVSHILRQATRTWRSFGICFKGAADRVESVDFTLTVPSKDQDSSLILEGELESRVKHLTCSLWPCSTLHSPDSHLHTYRGGRGEHSRVINPISNSMTFLEFEWLSLKN